MAEQFMSALKVVRPVYIFNIFPQPIHSRKKVNDYENHFLIIFFSLTFPHLQTSKRKR